MGVQGTLLIFRHRLEAYPGGVSVFRLEYDAPPGRVYAPDEIRLCVFLKIYLCFSVAIFLGYPERLRHFDNFRDAIQQVFLCRSQNLLFHQMPGIVCHLPLQLVSGIHPLALRPVRFCIVVIIPGHCVKSHSALSFASSAIVVASSKFSTCWARHPSMYLKHSRSKSSSNRENVMPLISTSLKSS